MRGQFLELLNEQQESELGMRRELTQAAISPVYLPYISRISPVCELGMRRELTQAAMAP